MKHLLSTIILFSFLHQHNKNYREIFIFASDAGNASFIAQKSIFAKDAAGLKERDLRIHEITDAKTNIALFEKYKALPQSFTFILIGKDGGEKFRSNKPINLEKLYAKIDAMPRRKIEMQTKP
jgi:hypothetical protein